MTTTKRTASATISQSQPADTTCPKGIPTKKSKLDPINVKIGERIKMRRKFLGLSQKKLAILLGINLSSLQKYENADNAIYMSSLINIAQVLNVPINFFFEDTNDYPAKATVAKCTLSKDQINELCLHAVSIEPNPHKRQEGLEFLKAYFVLLQQTPEIAQKIVQLVKDTSNNNHSSKRYAPSSNHL